MNKVQRAIYEQVRKQLPQPPTVGLVLDIDEDHNMAAVVFTDQFGTTVEQDDVPIKIDLGIKSANLEPGDSVLLGFQAGNALHPYIIARLDFRFDEHITAEWEDHLGNEYPDSFAMM